MPEIIFLFTRIYGKQQNLAKKPIGIGKSPIRPRRILECIIALNATGCLATLSEKSIHVDEGGKESTRM